MVELSDAAFPLSVQLVERMFVSTADKNYMLARVAFQANAGHDFYWLSLHALEKYFKAIRLLNGMSRNDSHDIATLHAEHEKRFPGLIIKKFDFSKAEKKFWRVESVRQFVVRLNSAGSASNRYGTYGYSLFPDDLAKVDSMVWSVRRCCRPIANYMKFLDPDAGERQGIEALGKWRNIWKVGADLPLEKLIREPTENPLRQAFLRANVPFQGNNTWLDDRIAWSSVNSPFADLLHLAQTSEGEAKITASEVLVWATENIFLEHADLKEIKAIVGKE